MSRSVQETPAEDTLTILEKIGKLKLTSTESALVSFLLSNSEMIASIQLNELAKQAYVSSATISRFVRKLGFKNYNDFRVAFVKERSGTAFPDMVVNYDNPLHLNMSTQDIENTIFSILEQTLKDVFVINDTASFEKASELIFNAKRIKIYGTSTYLSIANIFKLNMQRINKKRGGHASGGRRRVFGLPGHPGRAVHCHHLQRKILPRPGTGGFDPVPKQIPPAADYLHAQ